MRAGVSELLKRYQDPGPWPELRKHGLHLSPAERAERLSS